MFAVNDVRQGVGVFLHRLHIDDAADVLPAMTDEHRDLRFFAGHRGGLGIVGGLRHRVPRPRQECSGGRRGAARLHDRIRDVARFAERTDGVYPAPAGLQRIVLLGAHETVLIHLDAEPVAELARLRRDLHAHRQDHEIEFLLLHRGGRFRGVSRRDRRPLEIADREIAVPRVLFER